MKKAKYTTLVDEISGEEKEPNFLMVSVIILGVVIALTMVAHLVVYFW